MSQTQDQFAMVLKNAGQSLTSARQTVFDALSKQETVSMSELVLHCSPIDRASVYRSVALFERLGILQRLQSGWKYKLELSDVFHDHHHHATCLHCGKLIALPDNAQLEKVLKEMADSQQFETQQHQLELQGICHDCQLLDFA